MNLIFKLRGIYKLLIYAHICKKIRFLVPFIFISFDEEMILFWAFLSLGNAYEVLFNVSSNGLNQIGVGTWSPKYVIMKLVESLNAIWNE